MAVEPDPLRRARDLVRAETPTDWQSVSDAVRARMRSVVSPAEPSRPRRAAIWGARRSASISSTVDPASATATAMLTAVVDLPSPWTDEVTRAEPRPLSAVMKRRLVARRR